MDKKGVVSTVLAAMLAVGGSAAWAQPRPDHGHGPNGHGPDRGHDPSGPSHVNAGPGHRPAPGRGHEVRPDPPFAHWSKGDRVPPVYRGRQYVIDDWRGYNLRRPPRGYHWISTGPDFFLIGIGTGVVLESLLGR